MRRVLILIACAVAAGCVTARFQRLDPQVRPARAPDSVAVLEQAPPQPYTVIARIESSTETVFKGFDDLRAKLVGQAAQLGGDAVILGPESKKTTFILLPTGMIPSERKTLTAEVIAIQRP